MAKIEQGHILEILDRFKDSDFGEHNMMIYPDLNALREIYSKLCKLALANNEAVFILLHYLTRADIRAYLRKLDIDIYRYEKHERSLLILDSAEDYFGSAADFLFYLNIINKSALSRNKRGISIFIDMGSHYYRHRVSNHTHKGIDSLLEYEESLPTTLNLNVKILCLYHLKDFEILKANHKEHLLRIHFKRYKVITDFNHYDKKSDNNFNSMLLNITYFSQFNNNIVE